MIKAVLCDLDNTIIAWDVVSRQTWQQICRQYAPRVNGLQAERLLSVIDKTRDWYWNDPVRNGEMRLNLITARREVVAEAFRRLGINNPALAKEIADTYSVVREETAYLLPGAIDTLEYFRKRGYRLALVTNGPADYQRKKVEKYGLTHLFDYILIEGEFGAGKPDERVFLHALEQLGVAAAEAWMVGDNLEHDIGGAQKLGIFGIWVDWRCTGLPDSTTIQPDRIINTLSDLLSEM